MRRSLPLFVVLSLLVTPGVASAHGGNAGAGRNSILEQPAISTRDWGAMETRAEEARERAYRESGAYAAPSARPPVVEQGKRRGVLNEVTWSGALTFAPDNPLVSPNRGGAPCQEPECQEVTIEVPEGARALYVKVAWDRPDYGLYLFAFSPDGTQHGLDIQDRAPEIDKRPGNSTTLPLSEFSIADPEPGTWTIRTRAAWGLDVAYTGTATVSSAPLVAWDREDPIELSRWATHEVDVNVVFAGLEPTEEEIADLRANLPDRYQLPVLWWQYSDGGPGDSDTDEVNNCYGLVNWTRCHYSGTYSEEEREAGGAVPYFEPVRIEYDFHFIQAGEVFTKRAFAAMAARTAPDQQYHSGSQSAYLAAYAATQGQFRGDGAAPDRVDLIDAISFEDWLFENRFEFCDFTDLETGEVHSGGFLSPDPEAAYDPYYDGSGKKDLDRIPQGRNEGYSILFFDTHSPEIDGEPLDTSEYFRPGRYHNFTTDRIVDGEVVEARFVDPDTGVWDGIDYGRLWGGRYRFAFFDLGAAPNFQESTGWPNGTGGGSADYPRGDPPIWEYENNPLWQPRFWSQGIKRNITTMLFSRMTSGYLYRPIPRDIYQLTTTNINDHYSRPPFGTWWTDLTKIYNEDLAARWLSAAIPYATFKSGKDIGLEPYHYPGCSDVHVGSNSSVTGTKVLAPDPSCAGKDPDPLQRTLELAKAQGEDVLGAGIPASQAVSASVVRNYWEQNRETYAPIGEGVYDFILINTVFEGAYTWYLPAIVGGVAFNTPHRESWGQLQNNNDRRKPASAHDCEKSRPGAPGCGGVPALPTHESAGGLTYVVEHEASHGIGLLHPHDFLGVDKDANGEWNYYYDSMVWMPDSTQSPTTYFASIYPYGVWDQDNLMRGHAGEYIKMAQDAIAHAYFEVGRSGGRADAPALKKRVRRMTDYLERGRDLFAAGDYLHAEYAYRNAYLAAAGFEGREQEPRELQPGEKIFFTTELQDGPTREEACACGGPSTAGGGRPSGAALPTTGGDASTVLLGAVLLGATLIGRGGRRRNRPMA